MVRNTVQSNTSQRVPSSHPSLGYDFALLGLKAREARVEIIRRAAKRTAARIVSNFAEDRNELDAMLTDLAASTYRLLDPRRRNKPMERVQLCIYSESDLDLQRGASRPLVTRTPRESLTCGDDHRQSASLL